MTADERIAFALETIASHLPSTWRFVVLRRTRVIHGICRFTKKVIGVSRSALEGATDEVFRDIILHEVAHGLAGPYVRGHGREWKRIAMSIGAKPKACYHIGISEAHLAKRASRAFGCPQCGMTGTAARRKKGVNYLCLPCKKKGQRSVVIWDDVQKHIATEEAEC